LLIHGLNETDGAWETKKQTKEILFEFMQNSLKLDPNATAFVDYHRLSQ